MNNVKRFLLDTAINPRKMDRMLGKPSLFDSVPICNMINRPAEESDPYSVNTGPTKVDHMVYDPAVKDKVLIPAAEPKLLKQWKQQDLVQFYREQRSNYYR